MLPTLGRSVSSHYECFMVISTQYTDYKINLNILILSKYT